jgi:hypothetical protein
LGTVLGAPARWVRRQSLSRSSHGVHARFVEPVRRVGVVVAHPHECRRHRRDQRLGARDVVAVAGRPLPVVDRQARGARRGCGRRDNEVWCTWAQDPPPSPVFPGWDDLSEQAVSMFPRKSAVPMAIRREVVDVFMAFPDRNRSRNRRRKVQQVGW